MVDVEVPKYFQKPRHQRLSTSTQDVQAKLTLHLHDAQVAHKKVVTDKHYLDFSYMDQTLELGTMYGYYDAI